jgi:hypothetical protein
MSKTKNWSRCDDQDDTIMRVLLVLLKLSTEIGQTDQPGWVQAVQLLDCPCWTELLKSCQTKSQSQSLLPGSTGDSQFGGVSRNETPKFSLCTKNETPAGHQPKYPSFKTKLLGTPTQSWKRNSGGSQGGALEFLPPILNDTLDIALFLLYPLSTFQ